VIKLARQGQGRETAWRRWVFPAVAVILLSPLLTTAGRYVCRAAVAEAWVLWHRRPIPVVIADPATSSRDRVKLGLVLAARSYASSAIHLRAGDSFTTYTVLPHDTLVLVLSAAYRDRLEALTWWFPIVGRVPYKGFFDPLVALRAERTLDADGFDTNLRPSPAFSTLGFFSDPLVSTTLVDDDSLELANTVIHELTHNTFYAAGQATFNESFANFVGYRGAAAFFRARGSDSAARVVDGEWGDMKTLGEAWAAVYGSLDSAFRAHPDSRSARLAARDTIYQRARATLVTQVAPLLRVVPPAALARVRLDNASLLARRVYLTGLDDFDAVYARSDGDLSRTVARIISLARSAPDDPFGAVAAWVHAAPAASGPAASGPAASGPAASAGGDQRAAGRG
jgi:predicted aminopeptidase